jgi:hypothetical protein
VKPASGALENAALLLGSFAVVFFAMEAGYRIIDPHPLIPAHQVNSSDPGNHTRFDADLGWAGVPGGSGQLVTENASVSLQNNSHGFRDVEHSASDKPAIVFLGDSFTWGFEVEFDEMFVNLMRESLPDYELYNLAHIGYGTDQSMLTLRGWRYAGDLRAVVLVFYENDIADNNSRKRYWKRKPRFVIREDELVLDGVPIPASAWEKARQERPKPPAASPSPWPWLRHSHLLNDLAFRSSQLFGEDPAGQAFREGAAEHAVKADHSVTLRLLALLRDEVTRRGAQFHVVFIPNKIEVELKGPGPWYQERLELPLAKQGIPTLDLSPALRDTRLRTYHRRGGHWNRRGHLVAAETIAEYLSRELPAQKN